MPGMLPLEISERKAAAYMRCMLNGSFGTGHVVSAAVGLPTNSQTVD
jgi:hypothetical protein